MSVETIPDIEQVVGDYLRSNTDIKDLDARIVGQSPPSTATPWIRLTQIDALDAPGSKIEHLISYLLQADCYAGKTGGQPEASLLARTTRALLHQMQGGVHDGVVMSSVGFTGMLRRPDDDGFEPARERVILTALIDAHPA